MTYQYAAYVAIAKRFLGWTLFILALLSTLVSVMKFATYYVHSSQSAHDLFPMFKEVLMMSVSVLQSVTPWLDIFWAASPTPTLGSGLSGNNFAFLLIYFLIFVGMALNSSGIKMWRQVNIMREQIQALNIIVNAQKGDQTLSYPELSNQMKFPHHTIFLQIWPLYCAPIVLAIIVSVGLSFLQKLGF